MLGLDQISNAVPYIVTRAQWYTNAPLARGGHWLVKLTAQLLADFFAGALRLGEGGGSDGGAASAERFPTAADTVAVAAVMVDFDSGIERESGAAVSAVAP